MYIIKWRRNKIMGMYTELHFNSELKRTTPASILSILEFMINGGDEPTALLPDHPLFKSTRWRFMLNMDSYYFDADTISTLRYDDISESFYLCIRTNLKDYDNEIEKFIDWIMPYLNKYETGQFLGFYRYEEDEQPTLIFYKEQNNLDKNY